MNKIRCIPADIYKSYRGDCSNDGISSKFDEILIPCETGWKEIDLDNPPENLVKLVPGAFGTVHFEPYNDGKKWWMYGGTCVYSSDSRFREITGEWYPIKLHDRCE